MAVRQASRAIRPQYHPQFDVQPFANLQFADAGDVACNPYSIAESLAAIEARAGELLGPADGPHQVDGLITIGGDHTIAYALLKACIAGSARSRSCTSMPTSTPGTSTSANASRTARRSGARPKKACSTPMRRCTSASADRSTRHPTTPTTPRLGFSMISCDEIERLGVDEVAQRIRDRVGDRPLYLSIDIDVLDPAHAPGTGTPEIAGMTSRELVMILRGLAGMNLVSGDVVEVAPAYDHAEITSLAAATTVYELACLMAVKNR